MDITEIRIKLMAGPEDHGRKLKAFCSLTLGGEIVIRDLKVIEGPRGLFVAMPSRKLTSRCLHCSFKNPLRSRFCNQCGGKLHADPSRPHEPKILYADVAHPIHAAAREALQDAVLRAYRAECLASREEGYVPLEFAGLDYDSSYTVPHPAAERKPPPDPPGLERARGEA